VISRLIEAASGVSVRSQAARKFPHWIGQGKLKPVPVPVWAGDFSAMATAKYSGRMTIRETIATMIVSPQLTRPPSGTGRVRRVRIRGAATTGVWRLPR
jgi:hypothetical protein